MNPPFVTWLCAGLAALSAAVVLAAPESARACSCKSDRHGGSDPTDQLTHALTSSDAVFVGHVVKSTGPDAQGNYAHGTATLRVTEVFKGELRVGIEIGMPAGDASGDCSLIYEPESDVLVYAHERAESYSAGYCSRTRTLLWPVESDLEIQWLRSGRKEPPRPVALQRERVSCQRCTIATEGARLIGATHRDCCGDKKTEIAAAIQARRPFWAGGYYEREDPTHEFAAGIAKDGSAFQLVETKPLYPDRACSGRVEARSCGALEPDRYTPTCVSPGPLKPVCDERLTRQASLNEVESLGETNCRWRGLNHVRCKLPSTATPLEAGAASWPRLVCSPTRPDRSEEESGSFLCNIVSAPEIGGPSKDLPKNAGPRSR